ncbi:MAG: antibiotic biosynthesis monooxygenase [Myxococcota bacterium]
MVTNIITFRLKPDAVEQLQAVYAKHFAHLRERGERIDGYEVWQNKNEPTEIVTIKRFATRADEQAHHGSKELRQFVEDLRALSAEGAKFREVELLTAL